MTDTQNEVQKHQCGHNMCTCSIPVDLDYCGPSCRMSISPASGSQCFCGHAQCSASTGEAPVNL